MFPQVTIGVPVRNEARYLEQTLESVCRQTYRDMTVIISDNGSTDNSREIIARYAARDPRIVAHYREEPFPGIGNLHFLLDEAKTPYFMWLGGHDYLSDNFVEACVARLDEHPQAALATGRILWQREMDGPYPDSHEAFATVHMPARMAVLAWLWGFYSCFQINGLFRTEKLRQAKVPSCYAFDVAVLVRVLMAGGAAFTGEASYYATQNRPAESMKDQIRRSAWLGVSDDDLEYLKRPDARMGRFFTPCRDDILAAIRESGWPLMDRLWTAWEVRRVFRERLDYLIPS